MNIPATAPASQYWNIENKMEKLQNELLEIIDNADQFTRSDLQ